MSATCARPRPAAPAAAAPASAAARSRGAALELVAVGAHGAAVAQRLRLADAAAVEDQRVGRDASTRPAAARAPSCCFDRLRDRPMRPGRCRFATRSTCRSTGSPGTPSACPRTTFAVLRPTPGSSTSASMSARHLAAVLARRGPAPCRSAHAPSAGRIRSCWMSASRSRGVGRGQRARRPDSARTAPASPRSRRRRWSGPRGSSRRAVRTAFVKSSSVSASGCCALERAEDGARPRAADFIGPAGSVSEPAALAPRLRSAAARRRRAGAPAARR